MITNQSLLKPIFLLYGDFKEGVQTYLDVFTDSLEVSGYTDEIHPSSRRRPRIFYPVPFLSFFGEALFTDIGKKTLNR